MSQQELLGAMTRCAPFRKREDMFVRGNWQAELKGLEDAVKEAINEGPKSDKAAA